MCASPKKAASPTLGRRPGPPRALRAPPSPPSPRRRRTLEEHIDLPRPLFWSCVFGLALVPSVGAQRWTDSEYKVASDGTVSVRSGNLKAVKKPAGSTKNKVRHGARAPGARRPNPPLPPPARRRRPLPRLPAR